MQASRSTTHSPLHALRKVRQGSDAPLVNPGVDIPEEIACQNAIYDMVLVERVNAPDQTGKFCFVLFFAFPPKL